MPDTSDKLHYKDYIDQTLSGTFELLPISELSALRRRFIDITGTPLTNEERPSDEQLSALSHRLRLQKNGREAPPFVEFAVFGPYDGRSATLRKFSAHVLTREGLGH